MNFLLSGLGRYLIVRSFLGFGIAMAAVAASILLVDVVEQLRTIGGRADISLWEALGLTALKTPMLIEQTLPFVVLAGTMIGMIQLNRRSELIAMRASGVSAWRFLAPTAVAALGVGVVATTVLNPIGARLYERYEAIKARLEGSGDGPNAVTRNGVWLRQGDGAMQTVIHADAIAPNSTTLNQATFFFFEVDDADGALRFVNRINAKQAELRPSSMWELRDMVESRPGTPAKTEKVLSIPTTLEANALFDTFVTPGSLSFWRLPGFIETAREAGLAPVRYELKHQSLMALPLLLAAMASLGAVFSLRLHRLGGLAGYMMVGVGAGFLLYFATQLAAAFAITEVVPPVVAAWSPPLTGIFAALAILSFVEDG
ncbi:MAG: LPS export ABC transporter permease LptG [Hyphomonadaceae bacterium]|nr:LPS export ABC transporter permease LptG [Hyphomonadaceae bacterium]